MSYVRNLDINGVSYDIKSVAANNVNDGSGIKTWVGTKVQYDAIATKDANTIYDVIDDVSNNNSIIVDLNSKADVDLTNCTVPYVVSRTKTETGMVEIWSDGYCVQTGTITSVVLNTYTSATVNLSQSYIDTNYNVQIIQWDNGQTLGIEAATNGQSVHTKSTDSFVIASWSWTYGRMWRTEGYIR